MGEPFSIATGVVALMTTVVHIKKRLSDIKQSLRDAPEVLADMIHEVAALHTGLHNWRDTVNLMMSTEYTSMPEVSQIDPVIQDIERLLARLDTKLNAFWVTPTSIPPGGGVANVSNWKSKRNWLKEKEEFSRLRDELQRLRSTLSFVFLSINM